MKNEPIILERLLHAPVQKVWKALTDSEEMKHWYFQIPGFKPEVGFEFTFDGGTEDKVYVHLCTITEVVPFKKLAYSWKYQGYEGNSTVIFELFEEGENTRLRLTHEGLDTFPASNPDLAKENFQDGWNHIIGKSLKEYIEKKN